MNDNQKNIDSAADAALIGQNNANSAPQKDLTSEEHQAKAAEAAVKGSGLYHLNVLFNKKIKGNEHLDQVANGVATLIQKAERAENWTAEEIEQLWAETVAHIEALMA